MSVVGIIAEYNPLHNGHLHHIQASRRLSGAEAVVCVMSGSFTQRGEPALVDKWARAEMALRAGADLVFELPFVFAARSAYHFAYGAVSLLQKTGVVTHLCFGSELGEIAPLQDLARILHQEPEDYRDPLKMALKEGRSYPDSRARALEAYLDRNEPGQVLDWPAILAMPNNILALEYLRVLLQESFDLIPITIPRIGQGYHQAGNVKLAGASSIRREIEQNRPLGEIPGLTRYSHDILEREFAAGSGPVSPASMARLIRFSLSRMTNDDLAQIYDVGEGLENRIHRAAPLYGSREELIAAVKTRRYSFTRISRILLYILLGFSKEAAALFDKKGPLYLRLLGFSPPGQKILHDMKANSKLPVITKMGSRPRFSDPEASQMMAFDCLAADLHSLLQPRPSQGGLDFLRSPVRL